MLHEAGVEYVGDVWQDHQPIALSEHQQEFGDRRLHRGAGNELLDDTALARDGNRRVGQHPLQRVVAGDELREFAQVFLRLQEVEPLGEDHVNRARAYRVAAPRLAIGPGLPHCCRG